MRNLLDACPELSPLEEELLCWLLAEQSFRPAGIHGLSHWGRVRAFGLTLAEQTGADREIVRLFAWLHDACRRSDGRDSNHGRRAADLALQLRGRFIFLDDERFSRLHAALAGHVDGDTSQDPDIGCCWDADRLDLPRVGIRIRRRYLSTAPAGEKSLLRIVGPLSEARVCPSCLEAWLDRPDQKFIL